MKRFVKPAYLAFCILFATAQYEDEYKDSAPEELKTSIGSDLDKLVSVNAAGEIVPFHFNPAKSDIECEVPLKKIPKKKVVGGKTSNPGSVPYMISIKIHKRHLCGGAIYNSITVLTAAHCFYGARGRLQQNIMEEKMSFDAGEFEVREDEGTEQRRKLVTVQLHPEYDPDFSYNDIAIVTLSEPFEYNDFVQPIPIAVPGDRNQGSTKAFISGWGYTAQRDSGGAYNSLHFPKTLQEAVIKLFSKEECYGFYGNNRDVKPYIAAGTICAGLESGRIDACSGDSGGPLACYNSENGNSKYLCGIVCTGIGCGLPGLPGLYTRVSDFYDWIIETAGEGDA